MKYAWLQAALEGNGEVVTASRRLARVLRDAHDNDQLARGRDAWLTPKIWSWSDWLSRQLAAASDPLDLPVLLDPHSAELMWEQCLARHLEKDLPGFLSLVRQTFESWQKLEDWGVSVSELAASARSRDEQLFAATAMDYAAELKANRWVDFGGRPAVVATLLADSKNISPLKMVLAGFDRINPATAKVIAALERRQCAIEQAPQKLVQTKPGLSAYDNADAEMRSAGRWARERLDENPSAEVAIVVPALDADASGVGRLVKEGLVPGWQFGDADFKSAANVSYGRKLSEYPAVAVAMLLLQWVRNGLSSRDIGVLLRSRCVASDEIGDRIRLEARLRLFPDRVWSPSEFLKQFAALQGSADARVFVGCVESLAQNETDVRDALPPGQWAEKIDQLLASVNWPGPVTLDSDEFQLINRWRELLNEFARLQSVVPSMRFADAIGRLSTMASEVLYQPETGPGLVQVLGSLEAAGMEFDAVWIGGLDASQWPSRANPTRFVSLALQRKHAMPDATPWDTLRFARQVLKRLANSADEPIMSWVTTRDDLELAPSGLLDELAPVTIETANDPGWFVAALVGEGDYVVETDSAPAVDDAEQVRGGAYTVQRQFVEPFSAFVSGRLGVRALEPIATGLSASTRGNIIHQALHNLYANTPTQAEIIGWSDGEISNRIGSAVDSALADPHRLGDELQQSLLRLERNRLLRLLHKFVAAERERDEFSIVDLEKKLDFSRFGIYLGLRVDRIDRLADGGVLIIDYKTGMPKHFLDGAGDLVDLQLVVYAAALSEQVEGLAFLNVDSRAIQGKGAGGGGFGKHHQEDWAETLDSWQALVDKTLSELASGDIRVNLLMSVADNRPLAILSRKEEMQHAI